MESREDLLKQIASFNGIEGLAENENANTREVSHRCTVFILKARRFDQNINRLIKETPNILMIAE